MLWRAAIFFALFDTVLVTYLARFVQPGLFRHLKWPIAVVTGMLWLVIWLVMVTVCWEPVYHYVFPVSLRWIIPPALGIFFALAGLFFWWLALKLPGHPAISFCLLGGLWGIITHVWAIYRGLLVKPPMLQEASPVAASIMPFFEFVFYWCIILGVAYAWQRRRNPETN